MQRKFLPMAAIATGLLASPGFAFAQTTSTAPAPNTTTPTTTATPPTTTTTAPAVTAPATTTANPAPVMPPSNDRVVDNNGGGGGKWGLIGLIGLLGLSGLRPRRRVVTPADTFVPGTGPGTTVGPGPRV